MILDTASRQLRTRSHAAARSRSRPPATRTRSPGCEPVAEIAALIDAGELRLDISEREPSSRPAFVSHGHRRASADSLGMRGQQGTRGGAASGVADRGFGEEHVSATFEHQTCFAVAAVLSRGAAETILIGPSQERRLHATQFPDPRRIQHSGASDETAGPRPKR